MPLVPGTQAGVPDTEPQCIDATLSIHPILSTGKTSIVAFVNDLANLSSGSLFSHFGLGGEWSIKERFQLRAGIKNLYPAGGLSYLSDKAEVTGAFGSENIGTVATPVQDMQVWLQFKLRLR